MKLLPALLLLMLTLIGWAGSAHAEKADRDKPMNVEADSLRYDDLNQTSVFTGRVVLTKGSIIIRGGKVEVRQDAQGFQFGKVTGEASKPAFFRQKRDGVDEYIEGEGDTLEYDGRADSVKFIKRAQLRRYRGATITDEISGGLIVYNNTTDMFSVDGAAANAGANSTPNSAGRVRAMITPNAGGPPSTSNPPAVAASAPRSVVPKLRATRALGADNK